MSWPNVDASRSLHSVTSSAAGGGSWPKAIEAEAGELVEPLEVKHGLLL